MTIGEGTIDVCGSCSTMRKSYEHFQCCSYKGCPFVRADETATLLKQMKVALQECETYFDQRADVADYSDETGHTPNEEMNLLTEVQAALAAAREKEASKP